MSSSGLTIEIREAVQADAEAIGFAHGEAWRVGYVDLFPPEVLAIAVQDRYERWPKDFSDGLNPLFTLLVPVLDGRVVGFSTLRMDPNDASLGEVLGFYLHPDAWGTGCAEALMSESIDRLKMNGAASIHLWTHPGAARAHAFYAKAGFAPTGRSMESPMLAGQPPVPEIEFSLPLSPNPGIS